MNKTVRTGPDFKFGLVVRVYLLYGPPSNTSGPPAGKLWRGRHPVAASCANIVVRRNIRKSRGSASAPASTC